MDSTGWGCVRKTLLHQLNCVVFTPGRWTIDTRTLLFWWMSSARTDSKKPRQANFDEQYADWSGIPTKAKAEPTFTIVPRSRGTIDANATLVPQTWPRKVTSTARRKSSGSESQIGAKIVVIASLIQTSIGPSSASTVAAALCTCSKRETSVVTTSPRPPADSTSLAAAASPAWPRANSPTWKPCRASSAATARPTPALAPVTTATRRPVPSTILCGSPSRRDRRLCRPRARCVARAPAMYPRPDGWTPRTVGAGAVPIAVRGPRKTHGAERSGKCTASTNHRTIEKGAMRPSTARRSVGATRAAQAAAHAAPRADETDGAVRRGGPRGRPSTCGGVNGAGWRWARLRRPPPWGCSASQAAALVFAGDLVGRCGTKVTMISFAPFA